MDTTPPRPRLFTEVMLMKASEEHGIVCDCLMVGGFARGGKLETVALRAIVPAQGRLGDGKASEANG